jgi:hypothetical protein
MKQISFTVDEILIERAQLAARTRHTTLNAAFHEWLELYARQGTASVDIDALMRRLQHVRSAGPYTRAEMNER